MLEQGQSETLLAQGEIILSVGNAGGVSFTVNDLPEHIAAPRGFVAAGAPATSVDDAPFKEAKEKWVSSFEKEYIVSLLRKNNNNISHAAREADIDRKYFRKLMRKYGIPSAGDDRD